MYISRKLQPTRINNLWCKYSSINKLKEINTNQSKPKYYGQPTHQTHPQLVGKDEVTPLIKKTEYHERRCKLMENIAKYMRESRPTIRKHLIVIPSASKKYMSDKIPYVFRQNSEFLYLTGCQEPDSCLILSINDTPDKHKSCLFMREKNEHSELWDGPRTGPDNAPGFFGVDQGLAMSDLESYLQAFMEDSGSHSLWFNFSTTIQNNVHNVMCQYLNHMRDRNWSSPIEFIHRQMLIKSAAEIALMQKSCDVASDAIVETIKFSKPGCNEAELFAKIDYESRINGAEYLAYPPVIAGGNRANIIHYINNNQIINDGDMILMDAGCEYHGYSSDITRTWPVNGKFTSKQKELYEAVLYTQQELIELLHNPITLDKLFEEMCLLLGKNLKEIGLIAKTTSKGTLMKEAYQFCPHHVSHYLGMDVHDTPSIKRDIKIKPGMIITVEPGLYIGHRHKNVPKDYQGLGVRIEDDVLITDDGPLILTRRCPKTVADIEKIVGK